MGRLSTTECTYLPTSGILIRIGTLESNICRHYTGHDPFKCMASVETLKEVHQVC